MVYERRTRQKSVPASFISSSIVRSMKRTGIRPKSWPSPQKLVANKHVPD